MHGCRQGYLRRCGEVMAITGRRWRLRLFLQRWQSAAAQAEEGRATDARHHVLLRACFR